VKLNIKFKILKEDDRIFVYLRMGCRNSKLVYESACKKDKINISNDFKAKYADKTIREIGIFEEPECSTFYIDLNGYDIHFHREIEFIDFISQLERPFILDVTDDKYFIRFVNVLQ
jgi:hypothetical protein